MNIDLGAWVDAETDPQRREFRQAVRLILRAVANSNDLAPLMVMKGGILLAIRYKSARFTKDVDFSTQRRLQEVHLPALIAEIEAALGPVSSDNEYGLAIGLQSHAINPKNRPDNDFPTLQLKIGYANRASNNEMQRFANKQSAKAVQIDYSFNEWASEVERNDVDGGALTMYAYHDLIAEKLRSVLQQPIRNRSRFQDIYDLCLLLECTSLDDDDRQTVLEKLHSASADRQVPMNSLAMRNPEVKALSAKDYPSVAALIATKPPEFEVAYSTVQAFFESLPWPSE